MGIISERKIAEYLRIHYRTHALWYACGCNLWVLVPLSLLLMLLIGHSQIV